MSASSPRAIDLPPPVLDGPRSLERAIATRRSIRSFSDAPLSREALSQLLWALQGETDAAGHRAAPSAGACYPLETWTATADGVHHYQPSSHRLVLHLARDIRRDLYRASHLQASVSEAPVTFIIAAEVDRIAAWYGPTRAPRYALLEAGHAAQNLLLQAAAIGLGAVPIGAFQEEQVRRILLLPPRVDPLYLIPAGLPR